MEGHVIIKSGPDVNFLFEDLDRDGKKEILATIFSAAIDNV